MCLLSCSALRTWCDSADHQRQETRLLRRGLGAWANAGPARALRSWGAQSRAWRGAATALSRARSSACVVALDGLAANARAANLARRLRRTSCQWTAASALRRGWADWRLRARMGTRTAHAAHVALAYATAAAGRGDTAGGQRDVVRAVQKWAWAARYRRATLAARRRRRRERLCGASECFGEALRLRRQATGRVHLSLWHWGGRSLSFAFRTWLCVHAPQISLRRASVSASEQTGASCLRAALAGWCHEARARLWAGRLGAAGHERSATSSLRRSLRVWRREATLCLCASQLSLSHEGRLLAASLGRWAASLYETRRVVRLGHWCAAHLTQLKQLHAWRAWRGESLVGSPRKARADRGHAR